MPGRMLRAQAIPTGMAYTVQQSKPRMRSDGNLCHVDNQELVYSLTNETGFGSVALPFNPGIHESCPWLKSIARQYTKYRWELEFVYVPKQGVVTTPGTVYLAWDFDPDASRPETLAGLSSYSLQTRGHVFECVRLRVPANLMFDGVKWKRVRKGPVGEDLVTYDGGQLIVAGDGGTDTNAIGDLYICYKCELRDPKLTERAPIPRSILVLTKSSQTFTTTVATTVAFDSQEIVGFPFTLNAGQLSLPPGAYRVLVIGNGNCSGNDVFTSRLQLYTDDGGATEVDDVIVNNYIGGVNGKLQTVAAAIVSSAETFLVYAVATLTGPGTLGSDFKIIIDAI